MLEAPENQSPPGIVVAEKVIIVYIYQGNIKALFVLKSHHQVHTGKTSTYHNDFFYRVMHEFVF